MKKTLILLSLLTFGIYQITASIKVGKLYYNFTTRTTAVVAAPDNMFDTYEGDITIPETITYEGRKYTITKIDNRAFKGCTNLLYVTLPKTIATIGEEAFSGCSGLLEINLPYGVQSIQYQAFYSCSKLEEIVFPNSITYIGNSAFEWCTNLKKISLSSSMTYISNSCFARCKSLSSIVIPKNITTIYATAFVSCGYFSKVIIEGDVIEIGARAFGWSTINELYIKTITPPVIVSDGSHDTFDNVERTHIYVPENALEQYKSALGWNLFGEYSILPNQ